MTQVQIQNIYHRKVCREMTMVCEYPCTVQLETTSRIQMNYCTVLATGDWGGWRSCHVSFMFFLAQEPSKREIFEECSGGKIERNITIR